MATNGKKQPAAKRNTPPLPDPVLKVPERFRLNLAQLPTVVGYSEQTVRKWMRDYDDFPIVAQGWHGVPYVFDGRAVASWVLAHNEEAAAVAEAEGERLQQLRLELFGDPVLDGDLSVPGISPAEELQMIRARKEALDLGERQQELVKAADVKECQTEVYATFRNEVQRAGDTIARELSLKTEERARVDSLLDAILNRVIERFALLSEEAKTKAAA
jgi:phage terminase Nu1 subunit (DNA packaging protein)